MRALFKLAVAWTVIAQPPVAAVAPDDAWAAPAPSWEGVWKGEIGSLSVYLCLDKTPYQQKGAYYYDRIGRLLRLVPGESDGEWFEQDNSDSNGPRWHLAFGDNVLVGTWSDGRSELPVRLSRIGPPSQDYEGPCGSMDFHRPRVAPARLEPKAGLKDGSNFTAWTFNPGGWADETVEISTFTLDRPDAAAQSVNAILRSVLPGKDGGGEWLDCVASGANSSGRDGSYYRAIEPVLVTPRWLAAMDSSDYYCGGNHPETVRVARTFDLRSGHEVDPLDWFGPQAVHREDFGEDGTYKTLTRAFVDEILKGWSDKESPECSEAMRSQEYWTAGLARGGLVFSPNFPRVIMACGEEIEVPFERLRQWLNDGGKAVLPTLPR